MGTKSFIARKTLESIEQFVEPLYKEIKRSPDTLASVRALDQLYEKSETNTKSRAVLGRIRLDDAVSQFQHLADARLEFLKRLRYTQNINDLPLLTEHLQRSSQLFTSCLQDDGVKKSVSQQAMCIKQFTASLILINEALGPYEEQEAQRSSKWGYVIVAIMPILARFAWVCTKMLLLFADSLTDEKEEDLTFQLKLDITPNFVREHAPWLLPILSLGKFQVVDNKVRAGNYDTNYQLHFKENVAEWMAFALNLGFSPVNSAVQHICACTNINPSFIYGIFFVWSITERFGGSVFGDTRYANILSYPLVKLVGVITWIACQMVQWFLSTVANMVTPKWFLEKLTNVLGVEETIKVVNDAMRDKVETGNRTEDAQITADAVFTAAVEAETKKVAEKALKYYWQLKTQKPKGTVKWNGHLKTRTVAQGTTADGDAFIWFFKTKKDADDARQEFRLKSENRGVRTYLERKREDSIECNSSPIGVCLD